MGQKALVIKVDMKWGLIDSMPSLSELTIVTLIKWNLTLLLQDECFGSLNDNTLLHLGANKKDNHRAKPYMGRI